MLLGMERVLAEDFFVDGSADARVYSPSKRRFTARHRELLEQRERSSSSWAEVALSACLRRLASSVLTESWGVGVVDAWTEGDDTFCVVYRWKDFGSTLGLRRVRPIQPQVGEATDAQWWGRDVADFDIGEPLGTVAKRLRLGADGISWWGSPGEQTPVEPT